jgi:hypothetical protein
METRIGKNGWIFCRLNRGYDNPFPESDMDVLLEPYGFADVVPWETACANVARDIYSTYKNKKLFVAMSGGIDGECVANSFYNLSIPFTPIIFKIGTLHDVDVWWAERWCKERNITPVIVNNVNLKDYAIRIVQINQQYCTRTASGPALFDYLKKYVESQDGVLVSGGGFAEYFPDENLEYMRSGQKKPIYDESGDYSSYEAWWDNKLVNEKRETVNEGFLFHEPDIINAFILEGHPWNFLSWTPEIMLSYICARDYTLTSAEDKARIMKCAPRPKVAGLWEYVYQTWPILKRWGYIRPGIGKSECDFLGTVEELKRKLGNI